MSSVSESYQKLFLRGYPIKLLLPIILESLTQQCDAENQKQILENTVALPLVKQYPLKIEYMQLFLKSIIFELETKNIDVCDEMYEAYCELMNLISHENGSHYRHFMLSDSLEKCITVQESVSVISQGTTGLHTWQASQALVNWCTSHKFKLQNQCILELGSGVGLAGLAISSECEPRTFWFSDCHPSVLGMLLSNIKINVDRENKLKSLATEEKTNLYKMSSFGMPDGVEENVLCQGRLKSTDVFVMNLPWEDVADLNIRKAISPDVILAADVVYDSSSFGPLCSALSHLVKGTCVAVMACTIRNEDTVNQFVELLEKSQLHVDLEESTESSEFLNLQDMPIRIYRISQHNNT